MSDNLEQIRQHIDQLDQQIQELINQRAAMADQIVAAKHQASVAEYYRPEREAQVLRRIIERNKGPLSDEEMVRLFREIMSACLAQQEPLKVAYLGPEGTFTQQAVVKQFGHSIRALPLPTIEEVFHEVEAGLADFGIVPIENSTEGTVNSTLDMFLSSPLKISGEVELRIRQHLLARNAKLNEIQVVYSHQQSLGQCRGFLHKYLPQAEKIGVSSNAEAARCARREKNAAAIASDAAAEIYQLTILMPNIEDKPDNTTRFLVIGSKLFAASGQDKTSLLMSAKDQPGALYALLQPLANNDVSMTRIESRPSRQGKWDYVFFIDVDGHVEDQLLKKALIELEEVTSMLKVLGSYPAAIL